MVSRTPLWALVLSCAVMAGACADATCGPAEQCAVGAERCQALAREIAACYTGDAFAQPPKVRVRSLQTLIDERLDEQQAQDADARLDRQIWREGLAMVGLTAPDESLEETLTRNLTWAAQYDPAEDRITIVREWTTSKKSAVALLVHEYVHALQHARGSTTPVETTDAWLASSAMSEGEALLYQTFTLAEGFGFALDELRDEAFEDVSTHVYGYAYDEAYSQFTYDHGARWAVHAWREGGAEAVAKLAADPPADTRAVMQGPESAGPAVDAELRAAFDAVARPVLPARFRLLDWDSFGAFILSDFGAGASWVGDSFHVFHDDESQETVAVWRIALDQRSEATHVKENIEAWLDSVEMDVSFHEVTATSRMVTWVARTQPDAEVLDWQPIDAAKRFDPQPVLRPVR